MPAAPPYGARTGPAAGHLTNREAPLMNHQHHDRRPARQPATVMALVATVATALAAPERRGPRPTQRPLQLHSVGHVRPVTGPGRASVATAAIPTGHQVITRDRAAQLVEEVTPTLVNITARHSDGSTAAGTGIVLRSNGLVLTNDHVIAGAAALSARSLANGRSYRARVLAVDEIHDIAVIALRGAHDLPVGRFGNSSRVRIGDPVASVGNAWGLGGRPRINVGPVTRLSARIASTTHPPVCDADTDRASVQPASGIGPCDETLGDSDPGAPLTGLVEARNHLQPGESGGPMIDRTGRIVGLNVAYSGREGHPTGYGYAIPINRALDLAASMLEQS